MLNAGDLAAIAASLPEDPARSRILECIRTRAEPLRDDSVRPPERKAMLSRDGGVCPTDRRLLRFDPRQPDRHSCPQCGGVFTGERHDRHWARAAHLWFAERATDLAVLAVLEHDVEAGKRAIDLLRAHADIYHRMPNRDNVLGPTHLFFSTYLESLWITNYLSGAFLLREQDLLDEQTVQEISSVADEAAFVIGEFNEGFSNRQTWHAAALTAIAAWFDDHELAESSITSRTGLLGHLTDGFAEDGMWHEGENYHLFAMRGLLTGLFWARAVGADLLSDPSLAQHFREALLAPTRTALPDRTYPARGDARFGVSLAQPAFLECWEVGSAWLGGDGELHRWLTDLYARDVEEDPYDAWLHDAGLPPRPSRTRGDLSWWALCGMERAPAEPPASWVATSSFLPSQGLAILRHEDRYVSLECGSRRAGHAHPDRLHLSVFGGSTAWFPDPGTGSYVATDLAWYRSPLAHNSPLLDGRDAGQEAVQCVAFQQANGWGWIRGVAEGLSRTVVLAPTHVVDLVVVTGRSTARVELPWHPGVEWAVLDPGGWIPVETSIPFITAAERFQPVGDGEGLTLRAGDEDGEHLTVHLHAVGAEVLRLRGPALPTETGERAFLLLRAEATPLRWAALLDFAPVGTPEAVAELRVEDGTVVARTGAGAFGYTVGDTALRVSHPLGELELSGALTYAEPPQSLFEPKPSWDAVADVPRAWAVPPLDGSLEGFDQAEPLELSGELQYRRSEEPYDPNTFQARGWLSWDDDALYLALEVEKPDVVPYDPEAPPLLLDNEPDDLHADGIQVYLGLHEGSVVGYVVTLEASGSLRARTVDWGAPSDGGIEGSWCATDSGYRVTLAIREPRLAAIGEGGTIGFDLIVNEMRPDRQRRAGQLVWSGGGGWVYLRGDRHDPALLGRLRLR